ncbi:MAG: RNA polymerase sigma factor [Vulcanimicrobiaceae bacterium]
MIRDEAYRAADEAARYAFGRIVAYLARRTGDLASAEDALADAFAAALERWPRDGVPARPEAWLLTAARRRLADRARREATRQRYAPQLLAALDSAGTLSRDEAAFPDERLEMLFACAHPAIDASARTPLLLRAVFGVDAGRIASAFLVSPTAMRQRLVRARTKIRDAGIAFEVPDGDALGDRLGNVLDAIYAAFGLSWEERDSRGAGSDLNCESLWLASAVAERFPAASEARGLLALVSFVEARRHARRGPTGAFIALDEQDVSLWSRPLLERGRTALAAIDASRIGRYGLEAAIQAAHVARLRDGRASWRTIAALYDALVARSGALGAAVSRAAAHARAFGGGAGIEILDALDPALVATYQPYWALRADMTGAAADYARAIGLTSDEATRTFLRAQSAGRAGSVLRSGAG